VERILLTSVSRYSFRPAGETRELQGIRIFYLVDFMEDEPNNVGFTSMEAPGLFELWSNVVGIGKGLPALCDAEFAQRMDRKARKPVLTLVGITYVRAVDFSKVFDGGKLALSAVGD
jgi:hypothetical protein